MPVEAQIRSLEPPCTARVTATVIPLSLKEPDGFCPSFLTWSLLSPNFAPILLTRTRGVCPSERETAFTSGSSGSAFLYPQMPGCVVSP